MLNVLRCGDERGVENLATLCIIQAVVRIFNECRYAAAGSCMRRFIQLIGKEAQSVDLDTCLRLMVLEQPPQAERRGASRHLRQLCEDLFLRVHEIVELGSVKIAKSNSSHDQRSFAGAAPRLASLARALLTLARRQR
jgi:hypothetical protein